MQPRRKGASGSREPSQPCYTQSSQPNLQPSLQPTPEPGYQQSFQQNWTPWISQPNFPSHPSYSQSSHPPSNYRLHSSAPHHPHSSQPPIYEYQSSPPTYFPFQTQPNPQYPEYQSSPPAYFPFQTKPNPQYPEYQPSHPHVATQSGSQETVQPPPLTAPRRRAQSKGKSTGIEAGHRGPNLREEEDVALAKAFVAVGEDEEVGNKQKYAAMWKRIMEAFYEFMPDAIQRPVNMMQHRWAKMSKDVQTFNGLMRLHERNRQSGWTQEDVLNAARSDFREKANCAWKFDACWEVLKECPKWSRQSTTLNNLHNSVGRPGGSSSTSTPISLTSDVSMNDVYANLEPSLPRPAGKKTVTAEKRRKATNDKWDQQEVERAARLQAATESIQAFVEVKKKKVVAKKSSKLELLKQKKLSRFRKEDERLTFMDIRHLDDEQLQLRQARLHGLAEKIAALEKEDEDEDED